MLFGRHRVEEDLERIRQANLPEQQRAAQEAERQRTRRKAGEMEKGDIPAMIIAAFSVLGPYVLAFVGVVAVIVALIVWFG